MQRDYGRRAREVALNARIRYLGKVTEHKVASLILHLASILKAGTTWLPPAGETDPPTQVPLLNGAELYSALEAHRFPKLLQFKKQVGQEAALATLVLLQLERADGDGALEAWGRLEQIRRSRAEAIAGKHETERKVMKLADELSAGHERRELSAIIAERLEISRSQVDRHLRKWRARRPAAAP